MKTRDIVFYATLAVAALAMAGCEKSNDMPQESGPGHPAEIRFAPAIVPLTRATGTAFEEGDAVGIYCVESTDDPAAAIVGERYIDNKQLTMTAGTLTGTTPCFWPTEYTGPSDFYAYFPYNEKGLSGDKQSYEISVALDQSDDEAFRTSDHMLARAQNTARTEKAIPLDFKRLMSLLDFVLLPGTGYDDVDGILAAEVQVMNMAQVANVDFVTGEVSSPAIKANITPHGSFRASDGKAVGVEAIVPPQHVDTRSYLFNVRIGERNFRCTTDKELTFEALDEPKLTSYVNFLKDVEGLRNTSTMKQIAYLKWFLRWCTKKGYCMNNAYESFNPKLKSVQKKVIFLTWEELNKLKDYKIPLTKQYLERVRDVFLFCCFSGLRYSDVYNLKRSDIRDGYIEITTVKTADRLVIELNNHSRAILDKYKDVEFEGHKALPVISNQKMNDYLKELGELAEISEPVSETYYKGSERIDTITPKYALLGTHAGRRTFICNALALGIPAQVVMKWTGHSDYKAMKPYIDIADDVKANAMSKFNQL